jgi:hypothetical protein
MSYFIDARMSLIIGKPLTKKIDSIMFLLTVINVGLPELVTNIPPEIFSLKMDLTNRIV